MRGLKLMAAVRAALPTLAVVSALAPFSAEGATKHVAGPSTASFAYDTLGSVEVQADPASVSGPASLQFQGVTHGIYTPIAGTPIQLGQFVATPATTPLGVPTTFTNTPFEIEIKTPEFDKTTKVSLLDQAFPKLGRSFHLKTETVNSLLLRGFLNGTVSATGQANIAVSIGSIKLGGMEVQSMDHVTRYAFPIRYAALKLPPSWLMATIAPHVPPPAAVPAAEMLAPTPAAVSITATPTPEPSTLAFFAVLGGLAVAHQRRQIR